MATLDPIAVKQDSERIILSAGGQICDWLPHLAVDSRAARPLEEVVARALAMNALINIAFKAPVKVIADWIARHGVEAALSDSERAILTKTQEELTPQELINLRWYLESLWALMWVGGLADDLPIDRCVPDDMVTMVPNLKKNEDGSKFGRFQLRSYDQMFRKLDLYFRLHWYARNGALTRTPTPPVDHGVVVERRKALEWVLDRDHDWDHVNLNT